MPLNTLRYILSDCVVAYKEEKPEKKEKEIKKEKYTQFMRYKIHFIHDIYIHWKQKKCAALMTFDE